jgi:hypothetical protein
MAIVGFALTARFAKNGARAAALAKTVVDQGRVENLKATFRGFRVAFVLLSVW